MESMTRMEHVLDHAKFCGFSSNQVCVTKRPAFIQHTDPGLLEADSVDLHEVSLS